MSAKTNTRVVIKADGLALGKGVIIAADPPRRPKKPCESIMEDKVFGDSGDQVVVEEFLHGPGGLRAGLHRRRNRSGPWSPPWTTSGPMTGTKASTPAAWAPWPPTPTTPRTVAAAVHGGNLPAHHPGHERGGPTLPGLPVLRPDAHPRTAPRSSSTTAVSAIPETQVVLPLLKSDLLTIMQAVTEGNAE